MSPSPTGRTIILPPQQRRCGGFGGMNARQALEMNNWVIKNTIERAKRVMKVRGISYDEALDFCEELELKYETDRSRLAGIQIRYNNIRKK